MTRRWQDPKLGRVAMLFEERTGFKLRADLIESIETTLARLRDSAGCEDSGEFCRRVRRDQRLYEQVVDALVIGETYFFRDHEKFEFLEREVLPGWHCSAKPRLRVWCAGCSTGEEAYTLAIMLARVGLLGRTSIVATDISGAALEHARRGRYGAWSLRGEARAKMAPYLREGSDGVELPDAIKEAVEFQRHNLLDPLWPEASSLLGDFDLILCRNVLMYFDAGDINRIAGRLGRSLSSTGYLVAGPSDPPLGHVEGLASATPLNGVYTAAASPAEAEPAPVPAPTYRAPEKAKTPAAPRERVAPVETVAEAREPERASLEERLERVRALAEDDLAAAEEQSRALVREYPLSVEAYHLRAVIWLALDNPQEAQRAAKRGIYLSRGACALHLTLAVASLGCADEQQAGRAYYNAAVLADELPADQPVPLSDGERAADVARYAFAQAEKLGYRRTDTSQGSES